MSIGPLLSPYLFYFCYNTVFTSLKSFQHLHWQCMRYTVRSSPGYGDLWVSWKPSSETQASLSYTDHRPQANSIIFLSRSVSRTLPMFFFSFWLVFFFAFLCYCFNFLERKYDIKWLQTHANILIDNLSKFGKLPYLFD